MEIVNLIPMAGDGKRFKDQGFTTPKPLIDIYGKPMVVRALECLPKGHKNILVVRKDIIDVEAFNKVLDEYFDNNEIVEIDFLTEGQASTCLLAEDRIPPNAVLNIGACDIGFEYNHNSYISYLKNFDSFIWAYKNNINVLKNPNMYGWVKMKNVTSEIEFVSCKKPISENLLDDFVVSGTFTFKKASQFFELTRKMINSNFRINNEFYIDNVFNYSELKQGVFKVGDFFSWGTPNELISYFNRKIKPY